MAEINVVVLDDWEGIAGTLADWTPITARAHVTVHTSPAATSAELHHWLADADVVVLMRERTPFGRDMIAALPRLRLVVTTGMRNASLDLAACAERGVTVCHTGPGTGPVVELAWAMILSACRHIPQLVDGMRSGGWPTAVGRDLRGSRLGLLGLGKTGQRMAAIGSAFGMEVSAWSPHLTSERAAEHGVRLVTKDELFRKSDVVSLHLVLAPSTEAIVGAQELAALGEDGWLVNTSRAGLVDEDALVAACRDGHIAGATLDVYGEEPLPANHRLRRTPRVMLTPHAGYVTRENLAAWYADVVEDIAAWLDGAPIRTL